MPRRTGISGFTQIKLDNQQSELQRVNAMLDYVTMMTEVEIPTETEETENEQI